MLYNLREEDAKRNLLPEQSSAASNRRLAQAWHVVKVLGGGFLGHRLIGKKNLIRVDK